MGGAPWPGPAPGAAQGIRPRSDNGPTLLWPSTPGVSSDWARRVRGQGEDLWEGPVSIPVNLVRASLGAGERRGAIRQLAVRSLSAFLPYAVPPYSLHEPICSPSPALFGSSCSFELSPARLVSPTAWAAPAARSCLQVSALPFATPMLLLLSSYQPFYFPLYPSFLLEVNVQRYTAETREEEGET